MIIELQGVNFVNKGAELMMHATLQEVRRWDDKNIVAVRPVPMRTSFQKRAELGLYQLAWTDIEKRNFSFLSPFTDLAATLIPQRYRRLFGIITYAEVQAVLDASGFAFSDQWGSRRSQLLSQNAKKWKKQGKKIILLPQAFGPFEDEEVRKSFKEALNYIDLVFARDPVSYKHLIDLGSQRSVIKMAPDFTNLVKGELPEYFDDGQRQPCIVPNCRMLDKTSEEVRKDYLPFLKFCVKYFVDQGMKPHILVHDVSGDYELALQLQDEVKDKVKIISETNPVYIKGIIGHSHVVVGSRFHGLISALSQGVPVICAGWSHKYQMLLKDYDCSNYLVSPSDPAADVLQKLQSITEEPHHSEISRQILDKSAKLKEETSKMWIEVKHLLES